MSLFAELKRRNVVRVAVLYSVASWLLIQIADVLFDQLAVPPYAFRLLLGMLLLGFPIALTFAWFFELTPEGLKREHEVDRSKSVTNQTGTKINVTIVVLLVLAIGGLIADRLIPEQSPVVAQAAGDSGESEVGSESAAAPAVVDNRLSIAVLPFVNMSGDPENEYFSDGLSEELLNTLVQIRELKVTGRTSSFAFKGQNLDLREVGERLNVANVLEGSVRKADNRVRITAQLVKTDDGYHLWSETFDRELDDIFAIQREIAEQVANALSVTLLGVDQQQAGETINPEAFQLYLRGIHVLRRSPDDEPSLQVARSYFEQALALDPKYISPLDGMFIYWNRMHRNGYQPYEVTREKMRVHAEMLSQLSPISEEALLAQAASSLVERDWDNSVALTSEALERYPGSARSNTMYGQTQFSLGNKEEGLAAAEVAVRLDPLDLDSLTRLIYLYSQLRNCDKVYELLSRAIELEPDVGRANGGMGLCLLLTEEDASYAEDYFAKEPIGFIRRTGLAISFHRLDQQDKAMEQMNLMVEDYGDSASYQYAQIHAQWNEPGLAFDWLQKAIDIHDPGVLQMGGDPFLDSLRELPRFHELMQQIDLAP